MAPETPEESDKRRSMIGVAAYLLVPGERRRRAAGHFGRAAMEAARGVKALSVPARSAEGEQRTDETGSSSGGRQRIEIE